MRQYTSKFGAVIAITALAVAISTQSAQADVTTDPVGFYKVSVAPNPTSPGGANFIAAPLPPIAAYRGVVLSRTSNTITVAGSPFTPSTLGPKPLGDGSVYNFNQYIVIVKSDAAASPGIQGDWWPVSANSANVLTLDTAPDNLVSVLASNSSIEVRHLTTVGEMFGTNAATCVMNKDSNGLLSSAQEDLIRFTVGTSFDNPIFFHDGTVADAGYYYGDTDSGEGPDPDGSVITFTPGQGFFYFRKAGTGSTNALSIGQVQTTKLTHYMNPGGNAVGTGFPADAIVGTSGLFESGFIADTDCIPSSAQEDLAKAVVGTGFSDTLFYSTSGDTAGGPGWYLNDCDTQVDTTYAFSTAKAYFLFIKTGGSLRWRETVPFTP